MALAGSLLLPCLCRLMSDKFVRPRSRILAVELKLPHKHHWLLHAPQELATHGFLVVGPVSRSTKQPTAANPAAIFLSLRGPGDGKSWQKNFSRLICFSLVLVSCSQGLFLRLLKAFFGVVWATCLSEECPSKWSHSFGHVETNRRSALHPLEAVLAAILHTKGARISRLYCPFTSNCCCSFTFNLPVKAHVQWSTKIHMTSALSANVLHCLCQECVSISPSLFFI